MGELCQLAGRAAPNIVPVLRAITEYFSPGPRRHLKTTEEVKNHIHFPRMEFWRGTTNSDPRNLTPDGVLARDNVRMYARFSFCSLFCSFASLFFSRRRRIDAIASPAIASLRFISARSLLPASMARS